MSKNDEKILVLKKQIEEKKEQLKQVAKFNPTTNCSIELDGVRYNLNTLESNQLTMLLIKLNTYLMSIRDLDMIKDLDFTISGYSIEDWMTDVKNKLAVINQREEQNKLKQLEFKLTKMLSDEKKTELELAEIESLLK